MSIRDEQIRLTNLPEGRLTNNAGRVDAIKDNLEAEADPAFTDNYAQGYFVGSFWVVKSQSGSPGKVYVCTGDGEWLNLSSSVSTGHTHSGADITSGTINAARLPSNIPATKIANGGVTDTEFAYLDGVTSPIQTQINGTVKHLGLVPNFSGDYFLSVRETAQRSNSWVSNQVTLETNAGGFHRLQSPLYRMGQSIGGTGSYIVRNSAGVLVLAASQSKFKEDQEPIGTTAEDILLWQPKKWTWVEELGGEEDCGLIAEELAELHPEVVRWDYDTCDCTDGSTIHKTDGPIVPVGVHYERAWVHLLSATQDLILQFKAEQEKVAQLEERIAALENQLSD